KGGNGGAGAAAFGGGIYNAKGASLVLSGTIIPSNSALGGRGGQGGTGGVSPGAGAGAVTYSPPARGGNRTGGVGGGGWARSGRRWRRRRGRRRRRIVQPRHSTDARATDHLEAKRRCRRSGRHWRCGRRWHRRGRR